MGTAADDDRRRLLLRLEGAEQAEALALLREHSVTAVGLLHRDDWRALVDRLRLPDGRLPTEVSWRCGYAHHLVGRTLEAIDYFESAAPTDDPTEAAQLAAAHASARWSRGEGDAIGAQVDEAMRLAQESGEPAALAAAWVAQALFAAVDDRHESAAAEHRALRFAEEAGDQLAVARIRTHIACADLEEARYHEAVAGFTEAITLASAEGLTNAEALARINLAETLIRVGRLDEAVHEGETARLRYGVLDSPLVGAAWRILGTVHLIRGSLGRARHAFAEAVRYAEENGFSQVLVPALIGLGLVRAADDRTVARDLLDRARRQPSVTHDLAGELATGWFLLAESEERPEARAEALALAEREITHALRYNENSVIAEALELAVLAGDRDPDDPRLNEARAMWARAGNRVREGINGYVAARLTGAPVAEQLALQELHRLGIHADAWSVPGPLNAVRRPGAPVQVHCLGAFAVHVDGRAVRPSAWPSRKARDALKALAIAHPEGLTRSQLEEILWPDVLEPGNRLAVALSHLRQVLDPGRTQPTAHYVASDGSRVRLDGATVEIDAFDFRQAAADVLGAAEPNVELLEAVAARHTGVLLDGEDGDWTDAPREEVARLGREVTRALALALARSGDAARAVPWLIRQINDDPYDEPAYASLVQLLEQIGRHGEARNYYAVYTTRMAEVDVPARPWSAMTSMAH